MRGDQPLAEQSVETTVETLKKTLSLFKENKTLKFNYTRRRTKRKEGICCQQLCFTRPQKTSFLREK